MQKNFLADLLKRYQEGTLTPEENRLLETYYKAFETSADYTESLSKKELKVLKKAIRKGITPGYSRYRLVVFKHSWRYVAAASVVLIIFSILLFNNSRPDSDTLETSTASTLPNTGTAINSLMQLPDGSKAILTPGSRLDFPESFDGQSKREVTLIGEAYFDVERIPDKPFIVHSGKIRTTVLGTTFNVKALPGDESITVTVITGKVHVGAENETLAVLLPDEQIVYHVEEARKDIRAVDGMSLLSWKLEDLHCDDITVEQAALLIEKRYGVDITVTDDELKHKRFTTTFGKEETLEGVLNSLALFNEAIYTADSSNPSITRITLSPKND